MSGGSAFQARGPVMEKALSVIGSRIREATKLPRTYLIFVIIIIITILIIINTKSTYETRVSAHLLCYCPWNQISIGGLST